MEQRKTVYGPRMKKEEKKKTLVCLESKRLSYRAGAKVVLKKIINCHLHLRCKVRE